MEEWLPLSRPCLVGSMPHKNRNRVMELIMGKVPEIPFWPQLSPYPRERMMVQFLDGLPGIVESDGKIRVETTSAGLDAAIYRFYEEYLAVLDESIDVTQSRFALHGEASASFEAFVRTLEESRLRPRAVKGQVVGPVTLLSGLTDLEDRALLFDDQFRDLVVKLLAMKARWQIRRLNGFGCPVIIFIDEPALAGFGSTAYITVTHEQVGELLRAVVDEIHACGGLAGVHICANTDWLLAFQTPLDIINFDAYNYMERFLLYESSIRSFVGQGGIIAWGLVPTSDPDAIQNARVDGLANRWLSETERLISDELSLETVLAHSLWTPSCGCGTLSEAQAERVLNLTASLAKRMQRHL